nr:helix-turn-helix transcriptional regulator [Sinorhizobium sp. A49]
MDTHRSRSPGPIITAARSCRTAWCSVFSKNIPISGQPWCFRVGCTGRGISDRPRLAKRCSTWLVALNLRRLRVERQISQDDLALAMGLERSHAGHLERGTKNPTVVSLEKLALVMNCELAEFFEKSPSGTTVIEPLKSGRRPLTKRTAR